MDSTEEFEKFKKRHIAALAQDKEAHRLSDEWVKRVSANRYSYHFTWLGIPIIQFPQDIVAMQEIIWRVKPDLVIETGVAHGGSIVFYASMLELLGDDGHVVGIDIDIRPHNRKTLESHPLRHRYTLIEASSIADHAVEAVKRLAEGRKRILVCLDSNHTHEHVQRELQLYAPLVTPGSYIVVFDTVIEQFPQGAFTGRPWDKGDNPFTAVHEFLKTTDRFEIDTDIDAKLQVSVAPHGYLRCVK